MFLPSLDLKLYPVNNHSPWPLCPAPMSYPRFYFLSENLRTPGTSDKWDDAECLFALSIMSPGFTHVRESPCVRISIHPSMSPWSASAVWSWHMTILRLCFHLGKGVVYSVEQLNHRLSFFLSLYVVYVCVYTHVSTGIHPCKRVEVQSRKLGILLWLCTSLPWDSVSYWTHLHLLSTLSSPSPRFVTRKH